jgi:RNA polymerase sigma factor (sigma-70 family)
MSEDKNSNILHAVKQHGRNLLGFIRKRVKSDADAEDILQDVWYQFSAIVNSEPIEQTGAWLYKVARNKITDKYKKRSEVLLDDIAPDSDEEDDTLAIGDILLTDDKTPETAYMRDLVWEQLFIALDELPEEQRQVFIWHELEDIPFKEIAEMTGLNTNTLVLRKRYAVLHLRERLKQLYQDITQY